MRRRAVGHRQGSAGECRWSIRMGAPLVDDGAVPQAARDAFARLASGGWPEDLGDVLAEVGRADEVDRIYVFSNDTNWINYEALQSDIFDHLLAMVPEFGLRVVVGFVIGRGQAPQAVAANHLAARTEAGTCSPASSLSCAQ